jgi:hypothetical protein
MTHQRGSSFACGGGVSSPDELRSYAVDCARLAQSAKNSRDKARLLSMAQAWTELADRLERIGQVASDVRTEVPAASKPDQHEVGER